MRNITNIIIVLVISLFCFFCKVDAVCANDLFYDNFDDVSLSKWNLNLGDTSWSVVDGRLYGEIYTHKESKIYAKGTQNLSDFTFTADVENLSGMDQHYLFRVNEAKDTYYQFELRYGEPAWNQIDVNSLRLWKFVNGVYTRIVDIPYGVSQGKVHKLKVVFTGARMQVYLDGSDVILDWTDPDPLLSGAFGLHNYSGDFGPRPTMNYFDNILITDGNSDTPSRNKIIIIPGLGASWNEKAMVFGQTPLPSEWRMTPFVKNYDGLINALKSGGLNEGEDFMVWNYDWRRPISEIETNLNSFVNQNIGATAKIDLVGHSLGGLVARIWGQDNPARVDNVISLGSPHYGAVSSYDAWNGGKVSDKFDVAGVAMNILLQLNKKNYETNMETVRQFTPVVKDLLPDFGYLFRNGKPIDSLTSNDYLHNRNQSFIADSWVKTITGKGVQTKEKIELCNQNIFEKILGIWPDGKPVKYDFGDGDGTVLVKSSKIEGFNLVEMSSTHGDIVNKSVNNVLITLGLSTVPEIMSSDSLENKAVFYIGSPAKLVVDCGKGVFESNDFIVTGTDNQCQVKVVGLETGTYHLVYGLTNSENSWGYLENEIAIGGDQSWNLKILDNNFDLSGNDKNIKALLQRELNKLVLEYPKDNSLRQTINFAQKDRWILTLVQYGNFRRKVKNVEKTDEVLNFLKILMEDEYKRTGRLIAGMAKSKVDIEMRLIDKLTDNKKSASKFNQWNAINEVKFTEMLDEMNSAWKNNNYPKVMVDSLLADTYFGEVY